jgi:hypothetical protein
LPERTKMRGGAASGCARSIWSASDSIPDPHPLRKALGTLEILRTLRTLWRS